jgi:hypothetical protein
VQFAIGGPVNIAFDATRNDFGVAVVTIRVLDQRRDRERRFSSSGR